MCYVFFDYVNDIVVLSLLVYCDCCNEDVWSFFFVCCLICNLLKFFKIDLLIIEWYII